MNDDLLIIQLRDCFTAGYTFPQFCIDKGIKKPLFVAIDERRADFLWEIYIQFKYDKRITPNFCLLDGKINKIDFSVQFFVNPLFIKKFSEINPDDYDQIILLSANKLDLENRNVIRFEYVLNFFMNRAYVENPLLKFAENHRGVKIIMMNYPLLCYVSNPSEREKELLKQGSVSRYRWEIENDKSRKVPTTYDELGYTNQMVYELTEVVGAKINPDGSASLYDRESPLVGIRNGKRMVADQPENYTNRIFFFGNCVYYGHGVPYDRTVESYLQKFFNVNHLPYRVENESQPVNGRYQDLFYNLNKIKTKPGDIIFVGIHYMQSPIFPFIDTNQIFKRPHNHGEVFPDHSHINELGHLALAKFFFQILVQRNFFKDIQFNYQAPPPPLHRYGIPKENFSQSTKLFDSEELEAHKKSLRERRLKVGCIVMNANPFHLGHEYLIQYAASRVHKLFVMVVSEDKSDFTFAERFELVKRGTGQFPNVEVLPSGQFVISQKTFEGYFNKENLQDVQVDSSQDVELFASEIAPSLGINIRFVGEEPADTVTRTYNENMKNILPRYNVDVCEIPRREIDGEIISAKTVRAALKIGDFDKIKKLVPATTYKFLYEKYFKTSSM